MNDINSARPSVRAVSRGYGGLPKRILDIAVACSGLLISAIPMCLCAVAIMMEGGGPVIFRQKRIGADLRPFVCYKFRTMSCDAPPECATAALEHPERYITKVGAFLRRTSLDELPQLFNVLRGDMSLIGPRPVVAAESELIHLRNSLGVYGIRPGLTGLAQVRGRDSVSVRRKAAYDAQYVERMSFGYDMGLLVRTLVNVICCRGVREGSERG
ncbi:MAG: sugar transferase [Clostridia bacterium]|nr:sugar transferase [Clostridia bacterium]